MNDTTPKRVTSLAESIYRAIPRNHPDFSLHPGYPKIEKLILRAFQEQDQVTRHACAEAVMLETNRIRQECGQTQVRADTWATACGSAAHQACMNAQAI